jgi:hypothetical protein
VNALRTATPTSQRRFIDTFKVYTDSVIQQAEDRDHSRIRSIKSYFDLRRETIGIWSSFAINEIHLNLPDRVLNDPVIQSLSQGSNDMILICNDVYSYNVE